MHVGVVTIFPELFSGFVSTSLVGAAVERGLLSVAVEDLRRFTDDRHRSVDDEPYGGGGGMVMMAEPWLRAIDELADGRRLDDPAHPAGPPAERRQGARAGRPASACCCCAAATKGSTSGSCRESTRRSRSATSCSRAVSCRRWS